MKKKLMNLSKTAIFSTIICCFILSCTPSDRFKKMTPPIIVVAADPCEGITLIDKKNVSVTLSTGWPLGRILSKEYSKGDTILYTK
jgi:hypothetical protein